MDQICAYVLIAVLFFCVGGLLMKVWFAIYEHLLFVGPNQEVGPRRYCSRCGQRQDRYCWSWDLTHGGRGWWEVMGKVKNPYCECHNFAKEGF